MDTTIKERCMNRNEVTAGSNKKKKFVHLFIMF